MNLQITAEDILKNFGYVKTLDKKRKEGYKAFFLVYKYDTLENYETWKSHCLEEIKEFRERKEIDDDIRAEFDWVDLFWGLPTYHLLDLSTFKSS